VQVSEGSYFPGLDQPIFNGKGGLALRGMDQFTVVSVPSAVSSSAPVLIRLVLDGVSCLSKVL
jgi:hypothetical protein